MDSSKLHTPNIKEMVNLSYPSNLKISQDGHFIAYTTSFTNIMKNEYEQHCFFYDTITKVTKQLSHSGVVSNLIWLDNQSLLYIKSPEDKDDKNQIYLLKELSGEPVELTSFEDGITSFEVLGDGIIFKANKLKLKKAREEKFGKFTHVEQEKSENNLYYFNISRMINYINELKSMTKKKGEKITKPILDLGPYLNFDRTITGFITPNTKNNFIILNTQLRDDLFYLKETQSYMLKMDFNNALDLFIASEDEKNETKKSEEEEELTFGNFELISIRLPSGADVITFSPEDDFISISHKIRDDKFYTQSDVSYLQFKDIGKSQEELKFLIEKQCVTKSFDQSPMLVKWGKYGLYISYFDHSTPKLALFDLNGSSKEINLGEFDPNLLFDLSKEDSLVLLVSSKIKFFEFGYLESVGKDLKIITNLHDQIYNWKVGTVESIKWLSDDGLEIEGILRKPNNFDPSKKYPLVFIVHGGPAWVSSLHLLSGGGSRYYPTTQFLNKDILILEPNYRGSIGRGQEFLEKYKDNIGYGDMSDLESAIDHLNKLGFVDENKVGCMGWSQGGYISAFVSTHSKRFKAVSIGAGISSWYTYYIQNDIRQWAIDYLGGSPLERPEYYKTTAPMNKIKEASTPSLIQHGENDQRVPVSNATELHRAFLELEVPTELFIFKGMPHGITKPLENRAVMQQNLTWFSHWLLGEELDFFKD